MIDSPQSRFRLPHWGSFLLTTVVLAIAAIGLSIWLPWHREQLLTRLIEDPAAAITRFVRRAA